jgi:hypothetical protein
VTSKTASRAAVFLIAIAILFILIGIGERVQRSVAGFVRTMASTPTQPSRVIRPVLCDDADKTDMDFRGGYRNGRPFNAPSKFQIKLNPNCFSRFIGFPYGGQDFGIVYYFRAIGDDAAQSWYSIWWSGARQPDAVVPLGTTIGNHFEFYASNIPILRLEGKGTILFYSNHNGPDLTRHTFGATEDAGTDKPRGESESEASPISKTPQHEATSPPGTMKEKDGYLFTMGECRRLADSVQCKVQIANKEKERKFSLDMNTRMVDSTRHEHKAKTMALGSMSIRDCCYVETMMPPDVEFELSVGFEEVSPDAEKIQLLELKGWVDVQFHGVPVIK